MNVRRELGRSRNVVKLDVIMYDIESSRREECTIRVRLMRGIYNES